MSTVTVTERRHGLVVAFCGPDGSGKTTLASQLAERSGVPVLDLHHKPGVLPYPPVDASRDFTEPYVGEAHSTVKSLAKLSYLYLDWLLAWMLRIAPHRRAGGLVIIQRPWWDMAVDPLRYRLRASPALVRRLGRLMPRPDLIVLLEGTPGVIHERKPELSELQIRRQARAWREIGQDIGAVIIDVDRKPPMVLEDIAKAAEGAARGGSPDVASIQGGRWLVPRKPARAVVTATALYQPFTRRGRSLRAAARLAARLGLFRLMPRDEVPADLADRIRPWMEPGGTFAARRLRSGRWFVQLMGADGRPTVAIKAGITEDAIESIDREAAALAEVTHHLADDSLTVPNVRHFEPGLLVMDPVEWVERPDSIALPAETAEAMGRLFANGAVEKRGGASGRTHGDFAPWNLMWDGERWFVIDWEDSRADGPPFHDVFHYYVQSHALLGRPTAESIIHGLGGQGPVGESLEAYARGSGLDADSAWGEFGVYLSSSTADLDSSSKHYRKARERRLGLRALWNGGARP